MRGYRTKQNLSDKARELRRDVEAGRAVANRWDRWTCPHCGWEIDSEIRFPAAARKRHLSNHGIQEEPSRYGPASRPEVSLAAK